MHTQSLNLIPCIRRALNVLTKKRRDRRTNNRAPRVTQSLLGRLIMPTLEEVKPTLKDVTSMARRDSVQRAVPSPKRGVRPTIKVLYRNHLGFHVRNAWLDR